MKKTVGYNVKASTDSTGIMLYADWDCPYCHFTNHDIVFSTDDVDVFGGIEMDRECEYCSNNVTVKCPDVSLMNQSK